MKQNEQKITPELMRAARLVFYPKTVDESAFIQQKLLDMGAVWANGVTKPMKLTESVDKGLLSEMGKIFYHPDAHADNMLATIDQFGEEYMPPDRRFLKEQFDRVHARMDELQKQIADMSKKVDRLHDETFPTTAATKPKLRNTPGGA